MLSYHQQLFYDVTSKHYKIKEAISSKHEYDFKEILEAVGKENIDWFHQMAFMNEEEGLVAVCDFAFPSAQLIIELDGRSHRSREQKERDYKRDKVFNANDFIVLRMPCPIPREKYNYYKAYIDEFYKICLKEVIKLDNKKRSKKKRLFTKQEFERAFKIKMDRL